MYTGYRKDFLLFLMAVFFLRCTDTSLPNSEHEVIMTINGLIPADSLGTTLIHEHVFLDWAPADSIDRSLWNEEEAIAVILPHLVEMRVRGVTSFLECTPAYLGRNPALLLRLSHETGLQILTNTGFYAARKQQHLPQLVEHKTAEEIAEIWIREFEDGIENTGVRPGFIKIGVDSKSKLDSADVKIVRAAALTHLATGMTIVGHTGTDTTASQQLKILNEEGVAADAFVWTHAQNGTEEGHIRLGRSGVWISLDGLGWVQPAGDTTISSELQQYVGYLQNLKEHDLLAQVLISHDAGWYTVGAANQSNFKPYTTIFDYLIPNLIQEGFSPGEINLLLIGNPKRAYKLGRRVI